MPRPRAGPDPPPEDIYEFSMDAEEAQSLQLCRKPTEETSPLSKYIESEHQQAGLFSLSPFDGSPDDAAVDLQKKRRKKCGECTPCLRKKNCGTCGNCLNRKTGKQICKLRKCDELKRRRGEWEVNEVEYFEDNNRGCLGNLKLAAEIVHKVTSVDGLRSGGQMEIGSHDRLQEGALSLELANGVNRYSTDDEASIETEQQRAGGVPPGQSWAAGHGKAGDTQQQQQPCWNKSSGANPSEPLHHANMEDAHNLVAFSAIAGSLPPSSSSSCPRVQPNTAQLYEQFIQEMGAEGAQVRHAVRAPEVSGQPPGDLNTLQTALNQAKHGHKPPNCNCDGSDCPDYLEWLEKKIKLATNEDQSAHKITNATPQLQPHQQQPLLQHSSQSYAQVNGGRHTSHSQQLQGSQGLHPEKVPCSKPPIPCSPQVLSIAKEKNVSLQTAIAIEALTQLSGTSPQATGSTGHTHYNNNLHHHHHHHHTQNLPPQLLSGSNIILPSSSRSQSVPPPIHINKQPPMSCDNQRPQSQGQPLHATPLPPSTSPFPGEGKPPGFNPNPQKWQQSSGRGSEQRNPWMCTKSESKSHFAAAPHSSSDPMSELKQLLGDTSGKFNSAHFKLPVTQQPNLNQNESIQAQDNQALSRLKQGQDSGDHYHHTASMGHYGMANGQQQGQHYPGSPLSPGQATISHSTQAALQHHLHYKRNLFSNHSSGFGIPGPHAPTTCQNLKKWWPQMEGEGFPHLAIKQEPKEPKKKRSNQGSPVIKAMSGMLTGSPLLKPKQIVIKKTKQKASMPTFLPQTQISVQKPPVLMTDRAPALTSLKGGCFPSLPFHGNSTQAAAVSLPAPSQSQVSISSFSMTHSSAVSAVSENTPAFMNELPPPVAPVANEKSKGVGTMASSNTSTSIPLTSTCPSNTSQLQSLINIDPKYEELIRQFEAEFGDSGPDLSSGRPMEETTTASHLGAHPKSNPQDLSTTSSSMPQSAPLSLTTQASATPHANDQEMEVKNYVSGTQSEAMLKQASTESPMEKQAERPDHVSSHQESILDRQQQPSMFEDKFSIPPFPLPKRMKIETSGDIAVLSTTCYSEEDTPTKDSLPCSPSLRGFLESPLRYLDTPTKNLLNTPSKDLQSEFPVCNCVEQILEKDEGPYYNHLGSGPTVASLRTLMETRFGEKGEAVRIEKVVYTGREGKSSRGCPIAKWVIRRQNETEKLLCLVRERAGHHCENAVIIILIMAWEGVQRSLADKLYSELSSTITKFGNPTSRRCGLNDDRTCACQGKDSEKNGASFSFGCSWSMYFNGCKYARSKMPRKFRLQGDHPEEEDKLRDNFQTLATRVAPVYKQLAPKAYSNQCQTESSASECRLGLKEGRPFSGVTACLDFCAHAHKDQHNLSNGCTVVCTLTKEDNRMVGEIPDDEQLHVLPLYKVSTTDEFGSEEGQRLKMKTGVIQVLEAFRREVRTLPEPAKSCRQRRLEAKKAASEKKKNKLLQQSGETPEKPVVKAEVCSSPQPQSNGAIIKQEMKPSVKREPFNGSVDGYPVQAADLFNNIYSQPPYYARGGLPHTGQPSIPDPLNGYHHPSNLPPVHYGYYNYPPNALFRPKLRTYEGRNSSSPKAGGKVVQEDRKPDIQSLQAKLAQPYPSHREHSNQSHLSAYSQPVQPEYNQSRPSSVSSESSNRGTPIIKQEPMDVPVFEGTVPSQGRAHTPSTIQPAAWPGHRLNGSTVPTNWESHLNHKQSPDVSSLDLEKQLHQQHPSFLQQSTGYPGLNAMVSAATSLQVPLSPSHSPHPVTSLPGNMYQGPQRSTTSRPNTPGTPQPGTSHSGSVTPQPRTPGPGTPRHWPSPAPSPQPNAWAMGPAAYSPGLKHSNPAGAYPDKIWSKTGESRCSTPLGLQEKAWKSCGGSVAGSTPSPAPEGRLFPDALQQPDQVWDSRGMDSDIESNKGREDDDDEVWSDSEHNFLDPNIGGVAVAPAHGSILFECARRELHATTPLRRPDRSHPSRISLVFYQHKNLSQPMHGLAMWEAKMKILAERALQRQQEAALLGLSQEEIKALGKKRKWGATAAGASPGPGQSKDKREGPITRLAPTFHTTSTVTVSPYAFTRLTGPYSHFV